MILDRLFHPKRQNNDNCENIQKFAVVVILENNYHNLQGSGSNIGTLIVKVLTKGCKYMLAII